MMFAKVTKASRGSQKFFNMIVQKDLFGLFSVERYITTSSNPKVKEREVTYFDNIDSAKQAAYKELNRLISEGFVPLKLA
jgi:hypothetical protein